MDRSRRKRRATRYAKTGYAQAQHRINSALASHASALDLRGLYLRALPPELGQVTGLTYLSVSQNQLTTLPPELGRLSDLTQLDVSFNRLTALPAELGRLTALRALNASFNRVATFPCELGALTQVEHL